jgi:hypothetical protein
MANSIIIPHLLPIRFVPVGTPAYKTFFSDWYRNLVQYYEKPDDYFQKWIEGTIIRLQFQANFGPVQLQILDCSGKVLSIVPALAVATELYDTGFTTYEATFTPPVMAGTWFVLINAGIGEGLQQFISEPQITPAHPRGLLTVKYSNSFNDDQVVFDTGIEFNMNVEAIISEFIPKAKATVWEDQPMNLRAIEAIPYQQFKLIVGNGFGVPDWVIDKLNRIVCCTDVFFDSIQYTRVAGAEWQPTRADRYARAGWRLDIQPTLNSAALRGENNFSPAQNFTIVYNIDTRVFGYFNGPAGSNIVQITAVQE